MPRFIFALMLMLALNLCCSSVDAQPQEQSQAQVSTLEQITNFVQYSPRFASSGQPSTEQLKLLQKAGFQQVVYLAFSDNETAIANEDREVMTSGMDYVHIPVDFNRPTSVDFDAFAAVLKSHPGSKTLVHCQVNFRASTFSFLYRVIYQGVPVGTAKQDLDRVWQPNETWYRFLVKVLAQHGKSHLCNSCDWGEHEFLE